MFSIQILRPRAINTATRLSRKAYSTSPTQFKPAERLSGRTCMITGGTSGIGFAIAERFLQEGAGKVILVGRSQRRLADAAARLGISPEEKDGNGSDVLATRAPENQQQTPGLDGNGQQTLSNERIGLLVGDVSEPGSWMRELEKEMQPVDILINAAGISPSNLLPKTTPEDISLTLRTNLEGAILTSRALLRASIRNRRMKTNNADHTPSKCIINISSLLAHKGGTGAVSYAASKAGLLGLTRSLAVEAAGVRSNAIVPGYIDTPMIADFSENETNRLKESIPLRRFGRPHEIADAAVFLAQNEYANNCVLNLDATMALVAGPTLTQMSGVNTLSTYYTTIFKDSLNTFPAYRVNVCLALQHWKEYPVDAITDK